MWLLSYHASSHYGQAQKFMELYAFYHLVGKPKNEWSYMPLSLRKFEEGSEVKFNLRRSTHGPWGKRLDNHCPSFSSMVQWRTVLPPWSHHASSHFMGKPKKSRSYTPKTFLESLKRGSEVKFSLEKHSMSNLVLHGPKKNYPRECADNLLVSNTMLKCHFIWYSFRAKFKRWRHWTSSINRSVQSKANIKTYSSFVTVTTDFKQLYLMLGMSGDVFATVIWTTELHANNMDVVWPRGGPFVIDLPRKLPPRGWSFTPTNGG